jgi:UDP-N-acetylglucosamine 1-carboxyvinyltransferase
VIQEHLNSIRDTLQRMNISTKETRVNSIRIEEPKETLNSTEISTSPYPGFPTDLQPQFTALATQALGRTRVFETIFENRFHHLKEMRKLGANISQHEGYIEVIGPTPLNGCSISAKDLRGGASLLLAGLIAEGETKIDGIEHIIRGYAEITKKLRKVGADIERTEKEQ